MPTLSASRKVLYSFVIFTVLFLFFTKSAFATLQSCTAYVDPDYIAPSSSGDLVFTVFNSGPPGGDITWVKITSPSTNFTINSGVGSGWSAATSTDTVTFTGGSIGRGLQGQFTINASTNSTSYQGTWAVQASDSGDGTDAVTCSGSTVVAISGSSADTTAPSVTSDITITGVSNSSVTISWTTDEAATSTINYGTTDSYGSSTTETSATSTHAVSLTGLSTNTTYHFSTTMVDAWGNSSLTDDRTFTISQGATTTVTTTTTTTVTKTVTKPVEDKVPPVVTISTSFKEPFTLAPVVEGKATDVTSKIVKVEYSTDGGENWLTANANLGQKSVDFDFTPGVTEDGNYKIVVRATDSEENKGSSKKVTLIIDRLPPLVGGNVWSVGPILLSPDENGIITTAIGIDNKVTMSAVGGPTTIDLIVGNSVFPLTKSVDSGLWSGIVNFKSPGFYMVKVKSIDGVENITLRDLNSVLVTEAGSITENDSQNPVNSATISVYKKDDLSKIWSLWDSNSFGQQNPKKVEEGGKYSFFLPSGTYYLTVNAPGFQKVTSKIFRLDSSSVINSNFEIKRGSFFPFYFWDLFKSPDVIVNKIKLSGSQTTPSLIGTEALNFEIPTTSGKNLNLISSRGKTNMLIFLNSWLPTTFEQISQIKSLDPKYKSRIFIVIPQENLAKISVFAKVGGYDDLIIAADTDGTLIEAYKLNSLPTGFVIDRKGIIQKYSTGVTLRGDIMNYLDN